MALYKLGFPGSSTIRRNNVAAEVKPEMFKANALFKAFEVAMLEDDENLVDKFRGIYGFNIINGPGGAEGFWVVNAKTGKGTVEFNSKTKPEVTFTISDTDILDFISGKLNPQQAFFQGKVKIKGNMGLAMKLPELQKRAAKKIELVRSKL